MKRILTSFLFVFLPNFAFGQKNSIVGNWFWADVTNMTSMFFKSDGTITMLTGPKSHVIPKEDIKRGSYYLKDNLLVIKWANKSVENHKVKFIDKNTFQITLADNTNKSKKTQYLFTKFSDQ